MKNLNVLDYTSERGVHNPRIIDLIRLDQDKNEVVLEMCELRPWGSVSQQVRELEEKFNNYLDYVLNGFLAQQYPQYQNKPVRFVIRGVSEPRGDEARLLQAMGTFCQENKVAFEVIIDPALGETSGLPQVRREH